jgi:hypothetical protein
LTKNPLGLCFRRFFSQTHLVTLAGWLVNASLSLSKAKGPFEDEKVSFQKHRLCQRFIAEIKS